MKYIIYRRVSTEEQADSRNGLNAQLDACMGYVHKVDALAVTEVYGDEGVSGSTGLDRRPGLLDAIDCLDKGDVLLVAKRDRLGRGDVIGIAMIERAITRKGAQIVSVAGEGTENNDPSNILMRRMIDAFAEYELLLISQRTRAALKAKRNRGEKLGGRCPFGFTLDRDGVHLVKDTHEQETICLIKELKGRGYSLRGICAYLKAHNIPTKQGHLNWHHTSVDQILKAA